MTYWIDVAPLVVVALGVVGMLAALVWPRRVAGESAEDTASQQGELM